MIPAEPILSVCVITRLRADGLARLLDSLAAQRSAPPFEVVVIDNDEAGSAGPVVERYRGRLDTLYDIEPVRGFSDARNRSVRLARGRLLAFIDDDETAPPSWLESMHRVLEAYHADAVFGAVSVRVDPPLSAALQLCRVHRRPQYPEGAVVPWYHTHTSNALIRRESMPRTEAPFDVRFNLSGGEDIELFKSMMRGGARMVAAGPDARVEELRTSDRADFKWVMRRSLRNGAHCADTEWEGLGRLARWRRAAAAGLRGCAGALKACRLRWSDQHRFIETSIDAMEQFGRCLRVTGYIHREGRRT